MIPADPYTHSDPVPIIHVSGSHLEIGHQIGEHFRDQVKHGLENTYRLIDSTYEHLHLRWEGAVNQAKKYLPFAQERYPQYVDEIKGIAEGANVKFYDLVALNSVEAVTIDALHLTKCTSFAVDNNRSKNGHVLVAHNEDWLPEDESDLFLIHAAPDDEPPWIAMTYGGLLPNIGFNAAGIAQCCDSVYPNDIRIGIPRVIVSRAVLGAKSPSGAIRHMIISLRAAGYNHLLAHESGELYNVEVSAKQFAVLYSSQGLIAHTNHFLDPKMQGFEKDPDELISTRVRYFRALRLLQQSSLHTEESLKTIQRDHINWPDSICNHSITEEDPRDREKTVTSLIMDLTDKKMSICWGSPCTNEYSTYFLK